MKSLSYVLFVLLISISCQKSQKEQTSKYETIGSIEVLDDRLKEVIDPNAKIEIIASGFSWSEGPVWVEELNSLLFSDVPENKIYSWSEKDSIQLFISPSGFTGYAPHSSEQGANGLILDDQGTLLICQHGERRVASYDLSIQNADFSTVVAEYLGKRFNSPNDIVLAKSGNLYLTDPPYGLQDQDQDSLKELAFNGVYMFTPQTKKVELIDSTLSRPNGIGLSPDEKLLIVANSDPSRPIWRNYDLSESQVKNELLFDASHLVSDRKGLPDGLKINKQNIIFATGPGGVLILNSKGEHLGSILTSKSTANCALSPDEKTLYMTANDLLLRVDLK